MRRCLLSLAAFAWLGALHAQDAPATPNATPKPDPANFVPEVARAVAGEGNEEFGKGDYKAARRSYQKVLELAPGNLVALVNLGLIEYRFGNAGEAEKLLKQAVQLRLETGPAWLTLGMIYFEQNENEKAFAALSQAVVCDKGNSRAHNYLGVVLGRKGWLDGAEAELRSAVEIDPEYRDAHYNLAVIYLQRKPPAVELARRHYFKSIELGGKADPDLEKSLTAPAPKP
jgi:Flp pilus assembly protein TadD